jgi:predicted nucleic acid-binding protein
MSVISNTTVLSNFASIGQFDVLRRLYQVLRIPTEVYEEISTGLEEGYLFYQDIVADIHPFSEAGWLHLTVMETDELRRFGELPARLHKGEAACLAIAEHRHWTLLTDDSAAREEAARRGIRLSGSIGCLVLAVERELSTLEQANEFLSEMIRLGYRSPVTDITPLLKPRWR